MGPGGVQGLAAGKRQAPAGDFLSAGWAPPPPRYRRHPPRSHLVRVERGNPDGKSGHGDVAGQPTARKAQSPSEGRLTWEANAGGRKATGNRGKRPALRRSPRTTGRIRAAARTWKGADAGQVSLW